MPHAPRRIIVVGGGISGLAAAYRLAEESRRFNAPIQITLLEASSRLGGSLKTMKRDGFLMEGGPDCFITEKPHGLELCKELGLEGELIPTRPEHRHSFIVKGGKLFQVPAGFYLIGPSKVWPFIKSPILSWKGKLRVMMEPFVKKQIPSPSDESVGSFVKRRLGNEALTWLAQPLLAGIYGANPENLSLRATFPRFLEMEAKSGGVVRGMRSRRTGARKASGARYGLFASLKNGIQTLVDSLDFHLREKGVAIRKNAVVAELRKNPSRWGICLEGGEVLEADAVCLALPAYVMASLLRTHDKELADLLDDIPYGSSATINLAFRRNDISHPLDGFGFVVPDAEKRFLQAATFSHQKFAGRAPEGFVLIRGFVGGVSGGHFLKGDDATLERRTLQDLHAFLGLRDSPLFSLIERHARSLPQYTVGHMDRLAQIEKRYAVLLSSLALAGNWGRGVGIPDCIESGDRAGNRLLEVLGG